MEKNRYYIDTSLNDDEAYREAIHFACRLADEDGEIKRVVLLADNKGKIGWLERLFDSKTIKNLFNGVQFEGHKVLVKVIPKRSYDASYKDPQDVVITLGLSADDIMKIDDYYGVKAIIVIPWLYERVESWVERWGPIELRSMQQSGKLPLPDPIAQEAFKRLTSSINMSTGIGHSFDEDLAKTYIRALHKYVGVEGNIVAGYLINELKWQTSHAEDVKKLIDTLNDGRYFKGGDKTKLKGHVDRWKKSVE